MTRTRHVEVPPAESDTSFVTRCAWCRMVRLEGGWYGGLVAAVFNEKHRNVTHGICPECFARLAPERRYPA